MLKIFLVEDETALRESIRDTLDWEAAGFEYLGDAPDGEVAAKAIRRLKPDIVVTDIRMPFLDGLELARLIRDELPATKTVILSGHDDFTYAQQAIRLGVVEYILKPISPSALMRTLNKVALEIMAAREESGGYALGEKKRRRDGFLRDLLAGSLPVSEILAGVAEYALPFTDNRYVVAVMKAGSGKLDLARSVAIEELVQQSMNKNRAVAFERNRGEFVAIFQADDAKAAEKNTLAILADLAEHCRLEEKTRLISGLGGSTERLQELPTSLREAEIACNYAMFTNADQPCSIALVRGVKQDPGLGLAEKLDKVKEFLQVGGSADVAGFAREVAKAAGETATGLSLHYAYMDVVITAAQCIRNLNGEPAGVLPELSTLGEGTFSIESAEHLETTVADICRKVIAYRQRFSANRHAATLAQARKFMEENFADPNLSLQTVANHVHVSPTHFSAVFSRETGETFSDYLSRIRMANAMRLLRTTTLSAAEIAEKVGYNDPQYFSRAFKRAAGMSIRMFRNDQ